MNILQLIASLSILVFIHELGHYAMARLFGARVEKFYLFFNPWFSLFKYRSKRSGTVYGLGWIPLGGYCQIAGMVDEQLDAEGLKTEPKPDEFRSKKPWQRLLIMAGGVLMNLLLAFVIYVGIAYTWGDKHLSSQDVRAGWSFSPLAQELGFRDGDIIHSVDGHEEGNVLASDFMTGLLEAKTVCVLRSADGGGLDTLNIDLPADLVPRVLALGGGFASMRIPFVIDQTIGSGNSALASGQQVVAVEGNPTPSVDLAIEALQRYKGRQVRLTVSADGVLQDLEGINVDEEGRIGVALRSPMAIYPTRQISYGLLEAIPVGLSKAINTIGSYVSSLKYIFTKEGAKSMGGLGTMARLFPQSFSWEGFWTVTGFLSIILAVMNLLPIPALDGGHILFIFIEMITRRKLSDTVMMRIQTVGLILLLLLMLYANGNDIYRFLIK